jgi:poly-beta-1,6-N-acetyl-D-glucosamine synthase
MPKLLIVSPCRNEIEFAETTIRSIINQEVKPDLWIIVDDGSTDGTSELLSKYASDHEFISIVSRKNSGKRNVGPGVVEAFYEGLHSVDYNEYEYICKMDLDLDISETYFKHALFLMESNPRLATVSGKPRVNNNGPKVYIEPTGDDFSVGMIKLYKIEAFNDIGGFVRQVMWDGIDCHMCRYKGWEAFSLDVPELTFYHLRPMGSSQKNIYVGKVRHGFGQYFMGTSLLYFIVSSVYRLKEYPVIAGSMCSLYGYLKSFFQRKEQFGDDNFRHFLKRYQFKVLLSGRKSAMEYARKTQC